MTDTPNTEPNEPDDLPEQPGSDSESPNEEPEDPRGNREAAKYRKQLREAEAERDELRGLLTAARQVVLAGHVGRLAPTAVGDAFPDPNVMFNPDGTVNTAAVAAHMTQLRAEKPHLFPALHIPGEGKTPPAPDTGTGWEDAFTPSRR